MSRSAPEAIDNESLFQRIFLRLKQASLPHYAQNRHGPLEHGADIVALVDEDSESGRRILWMYQLKVGDLGKSDWRAVQPQLEEMFLMPLETINIDSPPDKLIGVLVSNGHAKPHVDALMHFWFTQELRDRDRRYEFMHLDSLARWIVNDRLSNAFRSALREVASIKEIGLRRSSAKRSLAKRSSAKRSSAKRSSAKRSSAKRSSATSGESS